MGLTVVTHTAGKRPDLLARCVDSVERQLPAGATHKIIQTTNFADARIKSLEIDDVIAFVDDDDVVTNDSLQLCWDQLMNSSVDVAFTNARSVDVNGHEISRGSFGRVRYIDTTKNHHILHHLVMFRTRNITETPRIYIEYGHGVDWLIKSEAAFKGGAIHLPIMGYDWTRHRDSMSSHATSADFNFPKIQRVVQAWLKRSGRMHSTCTLTPLN